MVQDVYQSNTNSYLCQASSDEAIGMAGCFLPHLLFRLTRLQRLVPCAQASVFSRRRSRLDSFSANHFKNWLVLSLARGRFTRMAAKPRPYGASNNAARACG